MNKEQLKKTIKASREEGSGIDALFSSTTNNDQDKQLSRKKVKTLTIDERYHSKIRQIAANDEVKISEIVYEAFDMYFNYRNIK